MKLLRNARNRSMLVAFWCCIILHTNFYLIEIKTLKPDNRALIESAKKLLATVEEEDSNSGETSNSSSFEEEIVFFQEQHLRLSDYKTRQQAITHNNFSNLIVQTGYYETFSPPPELLS